MQRGLQNATRSLQNAIQNAPKTQSPERCVPRTHDLGCILVAFCSVFAFSRSRFCVLPPCVLPLRSGGSLRSGSCVLGPLRSVSSRSCVLGCLAFWVLRSGLPCVLLAFCPCVLGSCVLLAFWRSDLRSACIFAFCLRSAVLLAFWRSALLVQAVEQ